MAVYRINRKLAKIMAWATTMAMATYRIEVIDKAQ
jgi:hypothetical protein